MRKTSLALSLLLALSACRTTEKTSKVAANSAAPGPLAMCYGYRGNGTSVFATVGGIARLFDQFGDPAAIVGTSSGSVAAFLTESILVPNDVYSCANCSRDDANERRSFMIKAFPLWLNALLASDGMATDVQGIKDARDVFNTIMKLNPAVNSAPPLAPNADQAKPAATSDTSSSSFGAALLSSTTVKNLISSALLEILRDTSVEVKNVISPAYYKISGYDGGEFKPELVAKAIDNLLNFQGIVKDNGFQRQRLMYPGLANFEYVFQTMGLVADWYAGYGSEYPRAELSALLDTCARGSRGQWWNPVAAKPYGDSTCGAAYYKLFATYFNARKVNTITNTPPAGSKRRLNEPMGLYTPAFVSTSAIGGNDVVAAMNQAADEQRFDDIDKLHLDRSNFRVLYFGAAPYKQIITDRKSMFNDVITQSIVSMGEVSWNVGMRASAQEPATARSVMYSEGDQNFLATGGYVDQLQSKLMKMIGCEKTVVVNTNSPIVGFAGRYSPGIWDKDPNNTNDIFSPTDPNSSESLAFGVTDALLCSRWESYALLETWEMADNSYHNVLFTQNQDLLQTQGKFQLRDGTPTTTAGRPKDCYSLPSKVRLNQWPAYTVPK